MRLAFYLTHPQVRLDPAVPVPEWGLSDLGRERAGIAAHADWVRGVTAIISSAELKAVETAAVIGVGLGVAPCMRAAMHENDRSATGFLPPPEFEAMADRFFASPDISVRGWERAVDAQARIVAAVDAELAKPAAGDVLFVGHGGVGTLLLCMLLNEPISRHRDQVPGGGCVFCFDAETRHVRHAWLPLEDARIGRVMDRI